MDNETRKDFETYLHRHALKDGSIKDLDIDYLTTRVEGAIESGDLAFIEKNIHYLDIDIRQGLFLKMASEKGQLDILKYLISHGANVLNNESEALIIATRHSHFDCFLYLLMHGSHIYDKNNEVFKEAILYHNLPVLYYLEKNYTNPLNTEEINQMLLLMLQNTTMELMGEVDIHDSNAHNVSQIEQAFDTLRLFLIDKTIPPHDSLISFLNESSFFEQFIDYIFEDNPSDLLKIVPLMVISEHGRHVLDKVAQKDKLERELPEKIDLSEKRSKI